MIDLENSYLELIKQIISQHFPQCEVWAFGSRVTGRARKYSDIDLVLIGTEKLDWQHMETLRDALSESDLPYMVDLLDWHELSESFREVIAREYEVLIPGSAEKLKRPIII